MRVVEIVTGWTAERLYNVDHNLFLPLFAGAIVAFICWFIMGSGVIIMDRKLDK